MRPFDDRRNIEVPGDKASTLDFCVANWVETARKAIEARGAFYVALSGGSTPKAIFSALTAYSKSLDWQRVSLFWSDERSVPPSDPESNFYMAMEAGFARLPLKKESLFRMKAEADIEKNALAYEKTIASHVKGGLFDLIMVGMGDDGHTASLFPHTDALNAPPDRGVVANYVPQKSTWRMTFTYAQLHKTRALCVYVLGKDKAEKVHQVLQGPYEPYDLPSQQLGTKSCKALWILDQDAARGLGPKR